MKKFGAMILAAATGSAITIGSYQFIKEDGQTVKIEHVDGTPKVQASYNNNNSVTAPFDFTVAAEKVTPAVVHIRSVQTRVQSGGNSQVPDQFRDFFGPFLRDGQRQRGPRVGSGSGVIISKEGYIVTNNHVIDEADDIEVVLNDNRSYKAKVIGTDPTTDLALIQIKESGLDYLPLVNSDNVKVGEWVLAVGNPFNLNSTVTAGIVSAKGRSIGIIQDGDNDEQTNSSIESFIQTDAAVNPGNSGGALVNLNGELVGINTAIASPTGSYSGYSFAVPSNIVNRVIEDLISYGTVQRGMLGAMIINVTSEMAKENDLDLNSGAYISEVAPNSGAEDAGIESGDVIVEVDGRKVVRTSQLIGYLGTKRPGDEVALKVSRDGDLIDFGVTLKNTNGNTDIMKKEEVGIMDVLGAELEEIDDKTKRKLDIDSGVRVNRLSNGKLKKYTDIREGFIITKIDGKAVKSIKDVVRTLEDKDGGVLLEGVYDDMPGSYYYGLGMD